MIKFLLAVTGIISFFYFLFPKNFQELKPKGDVLGIDTATAQVNKGTVEQAIMIYCLEKQRLPENLAELYGEYLDQKVKINLAKIYNYSKSSDADCNFELN